MPVLRRLSAWMLRALGCKVHTAACGLYGCQPFGHRKQASVLTSVKWGQPAHLGSLPVRSGCWVNGSAQNPAVSCCPARSCSKDERTLTLCLFTQLVLASHPFGLFIFPSAFLLTPYYQPLCISQRGGGRQLCSPHKYLTGGYSMTGRALGTGLIPRRETGVHLAHVKMIVWWGKLVLNT